MAGEFLGNFTITVPSKPQETDYSGRRSALFIPKESLRGSGFIPSEVNKNVQVTRDAKSVLDAVNIDRAFGSRDDIDGNLGLENDPMRQQMIVYTLITSGDNVLLYRRAQKGEGDKRLAGNASIGFGGHTGVEDLKDIFILEDIGQDTYIHVDKHDGSLRSGVARELAEELGISKDDVDLKVVGAFYEEYSEKELSESREIPVGAVHTCIIAKAELNSEVSKVTLQADEIAEAKWVKVSELNAEIEALKAAGVTVENWTSISASEFGDILGNEGGRDFLPEIIVR